MAIQKEKYGKTHIEIAKILYYISTCYYQINNLKLSGKHAEEAEVIYRNHNHPMLYKVLLLKAQITEIKYKKAKNKWIQNHEKAEAYKNTALKYYEEALFIAEKNIFNKDVLTTIQNRIEALAKKI